MIVSKDNIWSLETDQILVVVVTKSLTMIVGCREAIRDQTVAVAKNAVAGTPLPVGRGEMTPMDPKIGRWHLKANHAALHQAHATTVEKMATLLTPAEYCENTYEKAKSKFRSLNKESECKHQYLWFRCNNGSMQL